MQRALHEHLDLILAGHLDGSHGGRPAFGDVHDLDRFKVKLHGFREAADLCLGTHEYRDYQLI